MIILDLREQHIYDQLHICGAINIPTPVPPLTNNERKVLYKNLMAIINRFPNEPIGIYCKKGIRSTMAIDFLKSKGFKNIYNLGAFKNLLH